eukprot:PLAT6440.2.p1 GENE.PLAT6440.2~~PLAT6440.2.p1  ORF type:complete len:566 (-),score=131.34 PLAT6440.2:209-1906(-)
MAPKAYEPDDAFPRGSAPVGVQFERVERDRGCKMAYYFTTVLWLVLVILAFVNGSKFALLTTEGGCLTEDGAAESKAPPRCEDLPPSNVSANYTWSPSANRRLVDVSAPELRSFSSSVVAMVISVSILALAMAAGLGCAWMQLLRKRTEQVVHGMLFIVPITCVLTGVVIMLGFRQFAVFAYALFGLAILVLLGRLCIVDKLPLTIALMQEAMRSFKANSSILRWGVLLMGGVAVLSVLTFAAIVFVVLGTQWVITEEGVGDTKCITCSFSPDGSQRMHVAAMSIWLGWTSLLAMQVREYTIGGATAMWYFHEDDPRAKDGVRTALGWAVTTGFGTNAYAALILYIVKLIKQTLEEMRDDNSSDNFCASCVAACLLACLEGLLEFFNSFLVVMCAITGDDLCSNARSTYHLLRRNMLSAVVVDTVSDSILSATAFVLAVPVGVLGMAIPALVPFPPGLSSVRFTVIAACGLFAFVIGLVVLCFFAGLVSSFINSVFVCYAIDKDHGAEPGSHSDMHASFAPLHIKEEEAASGETASGETALLKAEPAAPAPAVVAEGERGDAGYL